MRTERRSAEFGVAWEERVYKLDARFEAAFKPASRGIQ